MSGIEPIRASISVRTDPARRSRSSRGGSTPGGRSSALAGGGRLRARPLRRSASTSRSASAGRCSSTSRTVRCCRGEVLVWEPHAVRARIEAQREPPPPDRVEIRFTPEADGTLVELEHRGWERLGDVAQEARAGYGEEWLAILGLFEQAIEKEVA